MSIRGIPASIGRPSRSARGAGGARRDPAGAFDKAIRDPAFLAEAKTAKIDMDLIPAEQVDRLVQAK